MTQKHPAHKAPQSERVSLKTRIGWGFGGLADNYIMNVLNAVFLVLYVQYFKMPPMLAGAALAIPRIFDAVTDPLIGNISDNTRSRWGRRRPYIVVGAILSAILLPLFWTPLGLSTVSNTEWWRNIPFLYVVVLGLVYALTYTLYVVPYTALGYELTNDYDERTRVLAWRMYIGLFGSLTVPLVYRLCQLDSFGNEARGAVIVSMCMGILIIGSGLIPAWVCREREDGQHQETIRFFSAIKVTMTNIPFVIMLIAYLIIIIGLFSALSLLSFLNIYYICGGNKDFAGVIIAGSGILMALVAYGSMFLVAAVASRIGKKTAMMVGLGFALAGALGDLIALDPRWPMAQFITNIIAGMGLQGCWLMVSSMVADICDEDELKTGLRREGMFGAVNGFALKAALGLTALIGAFLLENSGFNAETVDRFEADTIAQVIEPPRTWSIEDEHFAEAAKIFDQAAKRFELIADDKSAVKSGNRWTLFWRLIRGEAVYYRWYDFEKDVQDWLAEVQLFSERTDADTEKKLNAYAGRVHEQFFQSLEKQHSVAKLMKKQVVFFRAGGFVLALVLFCFYPITRSRAEKTRRILDERTLSSE
ncbi:MFS transporter [Tichowtungia aerotolerans]|uniref:MFS transporter n=1 Tax=Tichowtungia aerotolerans TaxID=2697043 RepID=A0A6P1M5L5_9BACT|nr:MFS transporter [Tichowtungia aerotolerans]QHI69147.1 MFS transporter [Tichowtungia aerotolerans]